MSSLGSKTCVFCGYVCEANSLFCGQCGKQLDITKEARPTITPEEYSQSRGTPILDQSSPSRSTISSQEPTQLAYYNRQPLCQSPRISKLFIIVGVLAVLLIGSVGFAVGQVVKINAQASISTTPNPVNQSGVPPTSGHTPPPTIASQSRVTTVTVFAVQGWQNTGVIVQAGNQVTIRYISGLWTSQSGVFAPFDGRGQPNGYICANVLPASQCAEAVPNAIAGSLVGKIGTELLKVGDYLKFMETQGGNLFLRALTEIT